MVSELTYQFIESSFIKHLELIDQLSVENILEKLLKVNVLCNNNKYDITLIYFAYYDLYITQLKKLNYQSNFDIDIDNDKINENIKKIRSVNQYAKLVEILINIKDKPYLNKTESDNEPPKKRQQLEEPVITENVKNPNEKEWVNWIVKNNQFADNFNPNNFIYCLNNLDFMINYSKKS
jgi:hypothetical protein